MVQSSFLERTPRVKARCLTVGQLLILSLPVSSSGNEDDDKSWLLGWL